MPRDVLWAGEGKGAGASERLLYTSTCSVCSWVGDTLQVRGFTGVGHRRCTPTAQPTDRHSGISRHLESLLGGVDPPPCPPQLLEGKRPYSVAQMTWGSARVRFLPQRGASPGPRADSRSYPLPPPVPARWPHCHRICPGGWCLLSSGLSQNSLSQLPQDVRHLGSPLWSPSAP